MLIKLTIPPEDRKPLIDLFLLDPKKRDKFLEAVKDPLNVPHTGDFIKQLQRITGASYDEANEMISALFTIYGLYDVSHENIDSIVSIFMEAFKQFDDRKVKQAPSEQFDLFRDFLKKVLSLHDSLGVRAKGYRLIPNHQRLFIRSEIYSDIRSVFRPEDPEIKPSAAVIVHSLKITYRESGRRQEIYIGLDNEDLQELNATVGRAIIKHETLKKVISDCGIQCLSLEEND
jgi:hypothetical protein